MIETGMEIAGIALLLGGIVWMVRRFYGAPVSEYGHILASMPEEDYAHLENTEIERQLEEARMKLVRLEAELAARSLRRHARDRKKLNRKIEAVRMALLKYELLRRSQAKQE